MFHTTNQLSCLHTNKHITGRNHPVWLGFIVKLLIRIYLDMTVWANAHLAELQQFMYPLVSSNMANTIASMEVSIGTNTDEWSIFQQAMLDYQARSDGHFGWLGIPNIEQIAVLHDQRLFSYHIYLYVYIYIYMSLKDRMVYKTLWHIACVHMYRYIYIYMLYVYVITCVKTSTIYFELHLSWQLVNRQHTHHAYPF